MEDLPLWPRHLCSSSCLPCRGRLCLVRRAVVQRAAAGSAALVMSAGPLAAKDNEERRGFDHEAFAKLTEGRVAGEPKSCVNTPNFNRVRVVVHVGVLYETHDTIWIAKANNPRTLDDFDVPVFKRFGSELCKFDRITMVDRFSGFFAGVLFLDDLVPYKKVDEDAA